MEDLINRLGPFLPIIILFNCFIFYLFARSRNIRKTPGTTGKPEKRGSGGDHRRYLRND